MWSVRRQWCAILSRRYLRGDRGTCEPQDLKDLFVSRDSKKNENRKGFRAFRRCEAFTSSPSFGVFPKPFPCIQRFPQIPICSMKTPIEFPPMLPGKVLFFFGSSWIRMGIWNICFLDCLGDFLWNIAQPFSTCRISFSKLPGGVNGRSVFFWWEIHLVSSFRLGRNAKWWLVEGEWRKGKQKVRCFFLGGAFIFLIFTHICGRCPFWPIFFNGVGSTTN